MESVDTQNEIPAVVKAFHEKLDELQFHCDINESKILVVDQDPHGFGGQLSRRMLGLQLGFIFDRTVVFCRPNDPPYVTCYVPTGKINFDEIKHLPFSSLDFSLNQNARVVRLDFKSFYTNNHLKKWFYNWIPAEFSENGLNRLFFDGLILSRFVLNEQFQRNVELTKERIGFKKPIIGLHIRRGDKELDAPFIPLKISLNVLRKLCDEIGINRVFVTSDNERIFKELPQDLGLDYIFDKNEKRYDNANHRMLQSEPNLQEAETLTATKIMALLSDCDGIVGPDNAHFTRLAAGQITARTLKSENIKLINGKIMESFKGLPASEWDKVLKFKIKRIYKRYPVILGGLLGLREFGREVLRVIPRYLHK